MLTYLFALSLSFFLDFRLSESESDSDELQKCDKRQTNKSENSDAWFWQQKKHELDFYKGTVHTKSACENRNIHC